MIDTTTSETDRKNTTGSRTAAGRRTVARPRTVESSTRKRTAMPAACTIVARNYLSHARILAASYLQHHRGSRFYLLVVDGLPENVDVGVEGVELVNTRDLELPHFYEMCFKYDVTELSTAVKPTFLANLIEGRGEQCVMYIDPDILIARPLDQVVAALRHSSVVLTPHLCEPIPDDGCSPSEQDILIAGAYNLGFLAVKTSPVTLDFLKWWEKRLRNLCVADPSRGLMVDQRWVDLVPTLFPSCQLVRDESYNAAYWNLHSREVGRNADGFTINGQPLTFFHFSGFNPRHPQRLSKHQTRHRVVPGSALAELLETYARLQFENGYEQCSSWDYGLSRFDNGTALDPIMRRLYLGLDPADRARFGDPFETSRPDAFLAWATTPQMERRGLSPFLDGVYRCRYDVAAAFPDVADKDAEAFLAWASTQGADEMGYDPVLVRPAHAGTRRDVIAPKVVADMASSEPEEMEIEPPAPSEDLCARSSPFPPFSRPLPPGINVCGYIRNESGLGTLTRGYIRTLRGLGMAVALKDVSTLSVNRSEDADVTSFDEEHPHPVNLVCVNADQHFVVMAHDERFFRDRYNIGVWNWELPRFPVEWHDRFEHYDEIWAGSSMIVNALAPVSPIPVVRMPPVMTFGQVGDRERGRQRLGLRPDEFAFLFIFDFHSYAERKNPLGTIAAFKRAFGRRDKVRLVIKCVNSHSDGATMAAIQEEASDRHIQVVAEYMPYGRVTDLMAACDAYVSLHRAEGIGLTIAEAMSMGKPVIATGWSGNVDFMDVSNSYPVSFELTKLSDDVGPYRAGETWAEPSVDHAAQLVRRVFENRAEAGAKGQTARRHVLEHFSQERVARVMAERLSVIEARQARKTPHERTVPHRYRGNRDILGPIREMVDTHVPPEAVVAVVSRGDPALVRLDGRVGWHFPRTENGTFAGYYPADSSAAIGHLTALRDRGARYFLVPATSGWWLEYYSEFRAHLDAHHELLVSDASCTLYRLIFEERDSMDSSSHPARDPALGENAFLARLYLGLPPNSRDVVGHPSWPEEFISWATATAVEETGLSPLLDLVYRLRPDVAAAFPDVAGRDRGGFLAWAAGQGATEMGYRREIAEAII
jgi:glycosyltransferase involved in cell wall biosynthesis